MEKILNNLKGRLLAFGITEEKYLKIIDKNKKIIECTLLNSIDLDNNKKGFGKTRRIYPKKLKKLYGYKNIDNILINQKEMFNLEKKLLPKYIYLTKKYIYIYNIEDLEKVIKRYNRYKVKIEKINESVLKIDVSNSKSKKILELFFYVYDSINDFFDVISELLVS